MLQNKKIVKALHLVLATIYLFATTYEARATPNCLAPGSELKKISRIDRNEETGQIQIGREHSDSWLEIREVESFGINSSEKASFDKKSIILCEIPSFRPKFKTTFLAFLIIAVLVMATPAFGTVSANIQPPTSREQIEEQFESNMEKPLKDAYKTYLRKKNRESNGFVMFENWVEDTSDDWAEENVDDIVAGINYDVSKTLDRKLIRDDGTESTFFKETITVGTIYKVDPFLLMMHSVLERSDLSAFENISDIWLPDTSRGNFQMKKKSLNKAVKIIYESFPDPVERAKRFPLLAKYPDYKSFEKKFDLGDYLDLDETNRTEIELAAIFLSAQFLELQEILPGYLPKDFLLSPLPDTSKETQNRLIIWTLAYTSDKNRFRDKTPSEIFQETSQHDPGVYAWSRFSTRVYQYITNIANRFGEEGFKEENFINISKKESHKMRAQRNVLQILGWVVGVPLISLIVGIIFNKYLKPHYERIAGRISKALLGVNPFEEDAPPLLEIVIPQFIFQKAPFPNERVFKNYLYQLSDVIMETIAKDHNLNKVFKDDLDNPEPRVLQQVYFSLNNLREVFGPSFERTIQRSGSFIESVYINLNDLMSLLEETENQEIIVIPRNVRVAA